MKRYLIILLFALAAPLSVKGQNVDVLWYSYSDPGSSYREAITQLAADAPTFPEGSGLSWSLTFFGPGESPDFNAFDVLVTQTWDFSGTDFSGILDNRAAIEAARGTRTFVSTQDADFHYISGDGVVGGGAPDEWNSPTGFLVNAVNWAASGEGLGIVALDDFGEWWTDEDSFLSDELDGWVLSGGTDSVIIPAATAGFPVNAGLTSEGLSNWGTSSHQRIDKEIPQYLSINDWGEEGGEFAVTIVTETEAAGGTEGPDPAPPREPSVIPTLSVTGLGLLVLALMILGMAAVRRF